MSNKALIWNPGVEDIVNPKKDQLFVGGISVQMYMWASILIRNRWNVYNFTNTAESDNKIIDNIYFIKYPTKIPIINPLITFIFAAKIIYRIRPKIIILSGADRDLLAINVVSKIWNTKIVVIIASDSDLKPDRELIGRKHDKKLFQYGLKISKNIVVQNTTQLELLKIHYPGKDPLIIPNLWINTSSSSPVMQKKDTILWVSNFRTLKRPEWFIRLAKDNPERNFTMIGFAIDTALYEKCKNSSIGIPNLNFKGGLSYNDTNLLFNRAELFVCTSEIEGFPNTFVQAWINNCPVISTFDPGGVVERQNLGIICDKYDDLNYALKRFNHESFHKRVQRDIRKYMEENYNAQLQYEKLIKKFKIL